MDPEFQTSWSAPDTQPHTVSLYIDKPWLGCGTACPGPCEWSDIVYCEISYKPVGRTGEEKGDGQLERGREEPVQRGGVTMVYVTATSLWLPPNQQTYLCDKMALSPVCVCVCLWGRQHCSVLSSLSEKPLSLLSSVCAGNYRFLCQERLLCYSKVSVFSLPLPYILTRSPLTRERLYIVVLYSLFWLDFFLTVEDDFF